MLRFELVEPFESQRSAQCLGGGFSKVEEECEVAPPRRVGPPGFRQLLAGVLPDGLEQAVARLGLALLLGEEQGLGHQTFDGVENGCFAQDIASTNLLSGG